MNFLYLMYLVQTKNELNLKRRRFLKIFNGNRTQIRLHESDKQYDEALGIKSWFGYRITVETRHFAYSKLDGKRGYEKAKRDMKAMTKHMKEVCKVVGAKYIWDSNGSIHYVQYEGQRYDKKQIAKYAKQYMAENILIGG